MTSTRLRLRQMLRPHPAWWAVAAAVALTLIGIAAIATVPRAPGTPDFAGQQARWLVVALLALAACLAPDPREIGRAAFFLAVLAVILLVLVILPFMPQSLVPVRNGTRAWINLQFMLFQPSELAKIAFVLSLARYLRFRENYRTLRGLLVPFAIMFVPVLLILREPDLGTAVLFAPVLFCVLIAAGARMKHLGALVGLGVLVVGLNVAAVYCLPASLQPLKDHQRDRIKAMVDQVTGGQRFVQDIGYQQNVAMALIGSAQVQGYGEERSATILRFNPLPEAHNDMIFAVIVNRWGLVGGLGVLLLLGVLIGALLLIAARHKDPFARLSIVGFSGLLLAQAVINIGMSLGVMPIIGITLPFVSYGGSSLVAAFAMLGLVVNFASQRPAVLERPSFEFDRREPMLGHP